MCPLRFLAALVALLLIASGRAETNVTIDDTDARIVYQPSWSFQGGTSATQDRFNTTTHFTSKQGATASLTFSGAVFVYYMGYGIRDLPSPANIPVTLQPRGGIPITVQCDAYRPSETRAQAVLFSSDRLNTTETYTITVTKTDGTQENSINVDAFILTQPEGGVATIDQPTAPIISLGLPGSTSTNTGSPAQTNTDSSAQTDSIVNVESRNTPPNAAAIAGGILGGIAFGIIVTFLLFRWWTKRDQQRREAQPTPHYSDDHGRFADNDAAPPYTAKRVGVQPPPQGRIRGMVDRRHSLPSTFGGVPFLTSLSTTPGQSSSSGRTEMTRAQRGFVYTAPMGGKAQYLGNSLSSGMSSRPSQMLPLSPEDTEYHREPMLPAYSRV